MHEELVKFLNELVRLELAMVGAYEEAVEGADSMRVKEQLTRNMSDHHEHVAKLDALVRAYGGKPEADRSVRGVLMDALTGIVAFGDKTALLAMRRNEEMSLRTYREAVRQPVPSDVRAALEQNLDDERRHLLGIIASLCLEAATA